MIFLYNRKFDNDNDKIKVIIFANDIQIYVLMMRFRDEGYSNKYYKLLSKEGKFKLANIYLNPETPSYIEIWIIDLFFQNFEEESKKIEIIMNMKISSIYTLMIALKEEIEIVDNELKDNSELREVYKNIHKRKFFPSKKEVHEMKIPGEEELINKINSYKKYYDICVQALELKDKE